MSNSIYDSDNIFHKIIKNQISTPKLYEDDSFIVINDKYPQAPFHYLIIPKDNYTTFHDFIINSSQTTWIKLQNLLQLMLSKHPESKIIINSGQFAKQEIQHMHIHIQSAVSLFNE